MRAGPGPVDLLPTARLRRVGCGLAGSGGSLTAGDAQARYLADDDWTSAWGISWSADRHDDVSCIGHSGGIPGLTTSVCFDPRQQVGAIVLHNWPSFTAEIARELAVIARRLAGSAPSAAAGPAPAPAAYWPLLGLYNWRILGGGEMPQEPPFCLLASGLRRALAVCSAAPTMLAGLLAHLPG